jgi:hypothetical protein
MRDISFHIVPDMPRAQQRTSLSSLSDTRRRALPVVLVLSPPPVNPYRLQQPNCCSSEDASAASNRSSRLGEPGIKALLQHCGQRLQLPLPSQLHNLQHLPPAQCPQWMPFTPNLQTCRRDARGGCPFLHPSWQESICRGRLMAQRAESDRSRSCRSARSSS